ncbi:NADH dehydrogenase (ubiquinone) Fe-S protein [Acrasis kona]|uniref:NADH dehydrogenase [ubiquinone] iron-sulfur protein 4, mitochondrial n=1 Tax=Acrasis kona TaxID=1008807 RepID=A0AAW2YWC6_9EUKA
MLRKFIRPTFLAYRQYAAHHGVELGLTGSSSNNREKNVNSVDQATENLSEEAEVSTISGIPEDQQNRHVTIYNPTGEVQQQGATRERNRIFAIDFSRDYTESVGTTWIEPLMGWDGSSDPLAQGKVRLNFRTLEDAVSYCKRNGWRYTVDERQEIYLEKEKTYTDNFQYIGPKNTDKEKEW